MRAVKFREEGKGAEMFEIREEGEYSVPEIRAKFILDKYLDRWRRSEEAQTPSKRFD